MAFELNRGIKRVPTAITLRTSEEIYEKLMQFSKQNDVSVSEAVRQMVEHCLAELDAKATGEPDHG